MIARNCTIDDLDKALSVVNKKYSGNIQFYEQTPRGRAILFRLKTASHKGPGCARAVSGRRTGSGCWHVHGDFFEALFKVNPEAVVRTGRVDGTITKDGGNWQDWNIGSQVSYLSASEGCDCQLYEELHIVSEEDFIKHIRGLDAEGVEDLLYNWGRHGEFIIKHCDSKILPLYINHEKYAAIACRRLGKRREAA